MISSLVWVCGETKLMKSLTNNDKICCLYRLFVAKHETKLNTRSDLSSMTKEVKSRVKVKVFFPPPTVIFAFNERKKQQLKIACEKNFNDQKLMILIGSFVGFLQSKIIENYSQIWRILKAFYTRFWCLFNTVWARFKCNFSFFQITFWALF